MAAYLHTLGDSTIDNLFWMLRKKDTLEEAKGASVEGILREKGHTVISHAYDGFTTHSVLGSDHIGDVLPRFTEYDTYMKEKVAGRQSVAPLQELQEKISEHPHDVHYVAISVGGNDFRVNLHNPWRLLRDISQVQNRYLQIIDKVTSLQGMVWPILCFQYRTDANNDPYRIYTVFTFVGIAALAWNVACTALLSAPLWMLAGKISLVTCGAFSLMGVFGLYGSNKIIPLSITKNILLGQRIGMAMFDGMLESFYQPILKKAREEKLPIVDLPNTFNPYKKLYDCGIEPNEAGGRLIAEVIDHVVKHHDFSDPSMLYATDSSSFLTAKLNVSAASWSVSYPDHRTNPSGTSVPEAMTMIPSRI